MKLNWRKYRASNAAGDCSVPCWEARTGGWFLHAYPDGSWCLGGHMHWPKRLQGQAGPDVTCAMEAAEDWLLSRLRSWGETGVRPGEFDQLKLSREEWREHYRGAGRTGPARMPEIQITERQLGRVVLKRIEQAEGCHLDYLGSSRGLPRMGRTDAAYREYMIDAIRGLT